jgi:2-phospho-L-lactate guanylyltransferase
LIVAAIPIRSFRLGKERLADVLGPEARQYLGRMLAERIVAAVGAAGWQALVVSADTEVESWAIGMGARFARDPGEGLDGAARVGMTAAVEQGRRWLVIHSDLPLLEPADLAVVDSQLGLHRDLIAPSSDGGTTLLAAGGEIEFAYGPGSFHRHLPRLLDPGVVTATGLLHDLDTPTDLESAAGHPRGTWLKGIY